jgi:hypothetical protein
MGVKFTDLGSLLPVTTLHVLLIQQTRPLISCKFASPLHLTLRAHISFKSRDRCHNWSTMVFAKIFRNKLISKGEELLTPRPTPKRLLIQYIRTYPHIWRPSPPSATWGRAMPWWQGTQWPRGLRHELSSVARTLGSWVRIQLKAWMSVLCAFILCVGRGLATGWSPVQGVIKVKLSLCLTN